jgi:hypothetical protein
MREALAVERRPGKQQGKERTTAMKAKAKKPQVKVRDMKPRKDAKGGVKPNIKV